MSWTKITFWWVIITLAFSTLSAAGFDLGHRAFGWVFALWAVFSFLVMLAAVDQIKEKK